ncbi:putative DNA binding domain-containing protein [Treponema sp.]
MESSELLEIISRGEDGKHQFKATITNGNALASEITAFSNSGGGQIFIGVNDDGSLSGLGLEQLSGEHGLNQLIPNVATNQVKPAVNVETENVKSPKGLVIVVTVQDGISKPYFDNSGIIWVKSGSDKRKVTSREEIQRLFQKSGLIYSDEIPVNNMPVSEVDLSYFREFYEEEYNENLDEKEPQLSRVLENMNLAKGGMLNVAGALLFGKSPSRRLPTFIVKAVASPSYEITESEYTDSRDIEGNLFTVFQNTMSFLLANLRAVQGDQGFNSLGQPEIPKTTLEELVVNALIHRDYLIPAPIRVFIFQDRVEIISPGHLPNNLTIENIISGNSNVRNPVLVSFATRILPYRGKGSGIRRALKHYPDINFTDDRDGNLFIVTLKRI